MPAATGEFTKQLFYETEVCVEPNLLIRQVAADIWFLSLPFAVFYGLLQVRAFMEKIE